MDLNRYIASKIGLAREMSGMSVATLARRAGMTPNALSESLRGNRSLTAAELVELALVLDIDLICFVEKERYDEILECRRQVIEEFGTEAGMSDLRQVRR